MKVWVKYFQRRFQIVTKENCYKDLSDDKKENA